MFVLLHGEITTIYFEALVGCPSLKLDYHYPLSLSFISILLPIVIFDNSTLVFKILTPLLEKVKYEITREKNKMIYNHENLKYMERELKMGKQSESEK